jgi:hypothetical protein
MRVCLCRLSPRSCRAAVVCGVGGLVWEVWGVGRGVCGVRCAVCGGTVARYRFAEQGEKALWEPGQVVDVTWAEVRWCLCVGAVVLVCWSL